MQRSDRLIKKPDPKAIMQRIAMNMPVPPGDLVFGRTTLDDYGELYYAFGRGPHDDGTNCFHAVWLLDGCPVARRVGFDDASPTEEMVIRTIQMDAVTHLAEFKRVGILDPSWWRGDARVHKQQYVKS